ncbi:MAG: tetratricopeptide repeat protein [Proteobacteria bacterium]|nr:tetratricopeptide repeat protein [Pseudomonadota bacterium]
MSAPGGADLIDEARAHLDAGRYDLAAGAASRAVAQGGDAQRALVILALCMEALGAGAAALDACRQAIDAGPTSADVAGELGRLALRQGRLDLAERALAEQFRAAPSASAAIELARAQRGQLAFDRAQATLTAALEADPLQPGPWLALAQLLCAQGRHAEAVVFFEETLRLDPAQAAALDGLADARLLGGDVRGALEASAAALAAAGPEGAPSWSAAHARRLLATGRLEAGWAAFAIAPAGEGHRNQVRVAAPRWSPGAPVDGRLLLFGEPDVDDEVLLSRLVRPLSEAGVALTLALDPSWTDLAQRSFPDCQVVRRLTRAEGDAVLQAADLDGPCSHDGQVIGAWAPMRAALSAVGGAGAVLAGGGPYLSPDPDRVAYWRERLAALGAGLKIGLVWRLAGGEPEWVWAAPPLPMLARALARPDLRIIGLQPEAVLGELGWMRQALDFPILDPPPEYHAADLADAAALALALDAVVGVPDAVSYAAAASGAATWFLTPPRHWALLGGETFPWFEGAHVLRTGAPGDWSGALEALALAMDALPAQVEGKP